MHITYTYIQHSMEQCEMNLYPHRTNGKQKKSHHTQLCQVMREIVFILLESRRPIPAKKVCRERRKPPVKTTHWGTPNMQFVTHTTRTYKHIPLTHTLQPTRPTTSSKKHFTDAFMCEILGWWMFCCSCREVRSYVALFSRCIRTQHCGSIFISHSPYDPRI